MELYLIISGGPSGRHVGVGALQEEKNEDCVAAVTQSKQDTMMEMMQAMMERLEKLETRERRDQPPASRSFNLGDPGKHELGQVNPGVEILHHDSQ